MLNVAENSHSAKPLLYKVTGVWGNHEGSMLLWVLILALFGAMVAAFGGNLPDRLKALVLSVQAWIAAAFLLFILFTSNPFLRLVPPPIEGNDLNPVLQDIGLAIHPPLLYLGYVGCSISFAFAVAALIDGRIDAAWARWVRPWTLAAWMFLTLGIAMGSYWAYYELGWGGFWFWDPVENASFMPWLAVTALLHSAIVMEKRNALRIWTVLLAILAFSLSLLGTFLVRSGVLTSVHTFAADPTRGVFILAILAIFIGGALALFAFRAGTLAPGGIFAPISREGALILNNLFLTAAAGAVLIGTLYPLVLESLTGDRISVGAPFFNLIFLPLMAPLLLIVPFGPMLAWKRGDLRAAAERLVFAFGAAILAAMAAAWLAGAENVLAAVRRGGRDLADRRRDLRDRVSRQAVRGAAGRVAAAAPRPAALGLRHDAGPCRRRGDGARHRRRQQLRHRGHPDHAAGRRRRRSAAGRSRSTTSIERDGPNYGETVVRFTVRAAGSVVAVMEPTKRHFAARQTETTEAAIATFGASQLYVSLGDIAPDKAVVVRIYWKPLVTFIWLGSLVMALGGVLSLSDRRLRVGAPRPARKPAAVPAE